ncbi:amidohydrolase [Acetobacter oeni]|uniref:Hydrolase n=1 Tax=Acetobacter oeni TaxID=304077 RepID=A0A511XNN8_9PROT|nr:amidohydrolase [Acetobacter oeni]MBB3884421.1 hippurate hydrolase [Acetobacter oeni]NHO20357.1 amidohydrolase [Acetobacter oeni]GBR09901.1 amidohydrolase [Acetobacter oeni LMG 21952]GEN64578.1 hydrolase [Acetobacter oeni]
MTASVQSDLSFLTELRRDLHAHPELRFTEKRTAGLVASRLQALGYTPETGIAKTGVVATLDTGRPGPAIMLRADMDALPIWENGTALWISRNDGIMHACGHDGHTVMLLGAAETLAVDPPERGIVHFVFQPAEEGGAGAKVMIDEGLFERFPTQFCFGLHNWPGLEAGRLGVRTGPVMAGGWRFRIVITGKGSHAAQPHLGTDPLTIGAALVQEAQLLVARRTDPMVAAVVSFCIFEAGTTDNILPQTATLAGTLRALDPHVLNDLKAGLARLCAGLAEAHAAAISVDFHQPYPVTVNAPDATDFARAAMLKLMEQEGGSAPDLDIVPSLASEDFGFMLERKPGAYAMIGNGNSARLHAPDYDFDDAIIPRGVRYWHTLAQGCATAL